MFLMGIFTTLEEAVAYDKLSDEKLLLLSRRHRKK